MIRGTFLVRKAWKSTTSYIFSREMNLFHVLNEVNLFHILIKVDKWVNIDSTRITSSMKINCCGKNSKLWGANNILARETDIKNIILMRTKKLTSFSTLCNYTYTKKTIVFNLIPFIYCTHQVDCQRGIGILQDSSLSTVMSLLKFEKW